MTRSRTASRVAAIQALFQVEQGGESVETVVDQFVRHRLGALPGEGGFEAGRAPEAETKLFSRIARAGVEEQEALDALIAARLPASWPMHRLDPVLRALLRAAAAELRMKDGPPGRVVINEYLDIANGFFQGDEPRMVNGLLDALARQERPRDFADKTDKTNLDEADVDGAGVDGAAEVP